MRTRKAILPDAQQIHELISAYSGDGTLLPRTLPEICENVRDFVVLEDEEPDHWLRRAALVWHAPGGDSIDHGRSVGSRQGRRWTACKSLDGRGEAPSRRLHLPVHAQA